MFRGSLFDRPFGSVFREMEAEMANIERRVQRILDQAHEGGRTGADGPIVYGWTLNIGPNGVPEFRQFGNVGETEGQLEEGWREPFVTSFVDEEKDLVRITAELPGVNKDTIDVEVLNEGVQIEATGEERRYRTVVPVRLPLDPGSSEARYNNGILEVTVGLREPVKPRGTKVKVR